MPCIVVTTRQNRTWWELTMTWLKTSPDSKSNPSHWYMSHTEGRTHQMFWWPQRFCLLQLGHWPFTLRLITGSQDGTYTAACSAYSRGKPKQTQWKGFWTEGCCLLSWGRNIFGWLILRWVTGLTIVFEGYVNVFSNPVTVIDGTPRRPVSHDSWSKGLQFLMNRWTVISCNFPWLGPVSMSRQDSVILDLFIPLS